MILIIYLFSEQIRHCHDYVLSNVLTVNFMPIFLSLVRVIMLSLKY
jgi:hypothetical protein